MSTTNQPQRALGCVEFASLFQNPLLEDPLTHGAPADVRRRYDQLAGEAYRVCVACPLLDECLYRSVVQVDVAGFAAATTPQQRALIRARLKITVDPEHFDTIAGVTGSHRQVDHAEVVRLRRANPQDSLEDLARRLGCSLSTVKRHLRRERNNPSPPPPHRSAPSQEQVRAVAAEVTGRVAAGVRAA
jgi:hypothetical protein